MFSTTSRTLLTALAMLLGVCFVSGLAFTTPQASAAKDDKKKDKKNRNKKNDKDKDDDKKSAATKKKPAAGQKKTGEKEEEDIEDFDGIHWNLHKRVGETWGLHLTVSGDSTNIPVRKGNTFFDCRIGNTRTNRADEYQPPFLMKGDTTRKFKTEKSEGGGWNKYVFSFWTRRSGRVHVSMGQDHGWDIRKYAGGGGRWVSIADLQIDGAVKKPEPAYMADGGWQTWVDNEKWDSGSRVAKWYPDDRERPQVIIDKSAPGGKYFRHWCGLSISLDVPKTGPENEVIISFYARSEGVFPPRTYEEYRRDFGDERFKQTFGEKFFNQKFGGVSSGDSK